MMSNPREPSHLAEQIAQLQARVAELEAQQQDGAFNTSIQFLLTEAVIIIDIQTYEILHASQACLELLGVAPQAMISTCILDYTAPESHDILRQLIANKQVGWFGEVVFLRDTKQVWCDIATSRVQKHKGRETMGIILNDITPMIEMFKQVQRSEAYYYSLVDTIPQMIFRVQLNGHITFVNQAFQRFASTNFGDLLGTSLFEYFPNTVGGEMRHLAEKVIRLEAPQTKRIRYVTVDGKAERYWSAQLVPVFDDEAQMTAIQGVIQDVTEYTSVVQQLQSSQVRLRSLMLQIPVGIQIFNTDGLCTDVNQAHLDIFGRQLDELVGKFNIFEDKMARQMATSKAARRALDGETVALGDIQFDFSKADERFAEKDLGKRWVNVTIFPLFDHRVSVTGFVGLNVDVTERKRREDQLAISEARYRAVVEDQRELISRYTPDGRLTFLNEAFCEFLGKPEEELLGIRWQDLVSPEVKQLGEEYIGAIDQDTPVTIYDEKMVYPDGKVRWVQWTNRGLFNQQGEIVEYQGLGIDITEKKEFEQQQFRLALEQERINILSDFVIKASHEFRTPLSVINSSAYAMTRLHDPDELHQRMMKINRQVEKITQLVESMTMMSQLDRQDNELGEQRADVNKMMQVAYSRLIAKASSRAEQIQLELSDVPLYINIKERSFVQAIELIGENALRFTDDDDTVTLSVVKSGHQAKITVSDTGMGMTPETREHIFERFYRADSTGKTSGLGLGLPIAQATVMQYNGTINLQSELGVGTTVTIRFPLLMSE